MSDDSTSETGGAGLDLEVIEYEASEMAAEAGERWRTKGGWVDDAALLLRKVPALVAEVRRLRAEVDGYTEQVEWACRALGHDAKRDTRERAEEAVRYFAGRGTTSALVQRSRLVGSWSPWKPVTPTPEENERG